MNGKPTVISTFAGCGGSSLGYLWAGYDELLAIEWDDNAVETFQVNFPGVSVWKRDIRTVTGQEILDFIGNRELDVLDGSPPCQGFSTSGKRQVNDERNDLFLEFARLINELQPKVFVMENVSGLIKGRMKGYFKEIMLELKSTGYNVKCKLINAMYYGVPQNRQRLIWIGVKEGQPVYPRPSKNLITVKEAWKGCSDREGKELSDYVIPIWEATHPGESLEIGARKTLGVERYFTHRKISLNRVCNTILKSAGSLIYHPIEPRSLSIGELKRLMSFPDNFQFIGPFTVQWARIGNSVPPKMMQAIAETIRTEILQRWHDMTGREPVLIDN